VPAWAWPDSLGGFAGGAAQRLFGWVLADVGPGRLMPWLAVSFGFGAILYFAAEQEPALWAALALAVGTIVAAVLVRHRPVGFPLMCMRDAIDKRIRAVLSGDQAAIASALITGKRDAISTSVNDAMFISGIGHVLSISGYHMVVVSGIVFVVLRALLALCAPGRLPIKK
jgi:predicted membrane metal-binding protein